MKLIHTLAATALAALVFSSVAQAMPPSRGGFLYPTLTKKSDSIKVTDVKDKKQVIELCADGKMLHCTKCKRDYRVTWNLPISKGGLPMYATKTVYKQGTPCMFVAKVK
jgi:hypothetical protein